MPTSVSPNFPLRKTAILHQNAVSVHFIVLGTLTFHVATALYLRLRFLSN